MMYVDVDVDTMEKLRTEFVARPEHAWIPAIASERGRAHDRDIGTAFSLSAFLVTAGFPPDTPEHFDKLDKVLRILLPDKYQGA